MRFGNFIEQAEAEQEDPKAKRLKMIKRQVLQKKVQAVRQGAGEDIVASHEPEGEMVEGVGDAVKAGVKRHKDAVEKKKIKNRKAVPYAALAAGYEPEGETIEEAERKLADRLARKRKVYDKTTKKAMKFARDEGEASGHARYRMSSISREMDGIKAKMKKEEVLVVDEGIGDMAIKAIEKTNPPHISKRSDMMRKIKLKQLKSYLKKQDEKKKKAASKD